ncbi:MAG: hypothetical protein HN509_08930 [Halobacteriovoraceae bacterium]|jgi:hypothetical protein|nr:hypothetical protein [Halobacteriovoraceae bacterium]
MKKSIWKKSLNFSVMLMSSAVLVACGGGGGGGSSSGGGGSSTYGQYSSAGATATSFVDALNDVDLAASDIVLYEDETYRSQIAGEEEWFVIYDDKYQEYKAVSLQYVRAIIYYDYYSNDFAMADEFRNIESDDIFAGDINGDFFGDNYEVVDYDPFTDSYWGTNSGFEYEDEDETTDVNLMTAEKEKVEFFKKASAISYTFNVKIQTAMSLVTLGKKVEKMVGKTQGEITAEDQAALMKDITKITGVESLSEVLEASTDAGKKKDLLAKVAKKIGTTAGNLESRLLPEVFGVKF